MFAGLQLTSGVIMEQKFEIIAERVLILSDIETHQQKEIKIQIGRPYWTDPGLEAACPVAVEGLIERRNDIRSIDPLHALELAISFAKSFTSNIPKTQRLSWPSGEEYTED
jgi:hypothetical protein